MNLSHIDTRGTESAALILISGDDDKDKDISTIEMLVSNSSLVLDDFYPSVAIATLMRTQLLVSIIQLLSRQLCSYSNLFGSRLCHTYVSQV